MVSTTPDPIEAASNIEMSTETINSTEKSTEETNTADDVMSAVLDPINAAPKNEASTETIIQQCNLLINQLQLKHLNNKLAQ